MQRYKTPAVFFSILLAVLMPLFGAFKAYSDIQSAPVVRFEIEPYDPRDLLYGHYMTFQIKWNWKEDKTVLSSSENNVCLCVGETTVNPEVSAVLCANKEEEGSSCKYLIPGHYYASPARDDAEQIQTFDADINRYYVDERFGLPLEKIFRDKAGVFSIGLGMKENGKPVVENLYVDDLPLKEYIDQNGESLLAPEPEPEQQP